MDRFRIARSAGMLAAAAAAASLLIALPAAAQDGNYNGQCRRLNRQIEQHRGVVERARERDDALWEANARAQVDRLVKRRSRLCPEYDRWVAAVAAEKAARETAEFLKMAGRAALTYFTFGAY